MPKSKKTRAEINAEIQERVTAKIIEQMESNPKWLKPFGNSIAPRNPITGTVYRGVNNLNLSLTGNSPYYATWKQWKRAGATWLEETNVADSYPIVYFEPMKVTRENKETKKEETFTIPFLKYFNVYNITQVIPPQKIVEQCEELDASIATNDKTKVIPSIDKYIDAVGVPIANKPGGRACYSPTLDQITMPLRGEFEDTKDNPATICYYSTLFHELTHSTGHKKRLNRDMRGWFGDPKYAFEELVAELGAAFHCQKHNIEVEPREDHAAYIQGWLKAIKTEKNGPSAILKAAALAQASLDYCDQQQTDSKTSGDAIAA